MKNPSIATPLLISLLTASHSSASHTQSMCFDALIHLPPTLNSFDVVGSLLRDRTPMMLGTIGTPVTVGEAIRSETLGYFLHECISWLDKAEIEEREGLVSEDIFAKGVQNVRNFSPPNSSVTKPSWVCSSAGFITRLSSCPFWTLQLRTGLTPSR